MIQIDADRSSGLLVLSFTGQVTAAQAESSSEAIQSRLAEMSPGFRLLADLSGLESMEPDCAPHLGRMMDLCNEKGVSKVVRVLPDPRKDIGLSILSLFHYGRDVRIVTCTSLAEAKEVLSH